MRINEIFYSLQGEGFWTGTPMVFVRFAGCNLKCPFCDTEWTSYREMSLGEILSTLRQYPSKKVCITGGEPCLQVTDEFVDALHEAGYTLHMESNGTLIPPKGIDWLTVSPKEPFVGTGKARVAVQQCDELKLLYPCNPEQFDHIKATYRFLQPIDADNKETSARNTADTIQYICDHPQWRLSLQIHKLLNIK